MLPSEYKMYTIKWSKKQQEWLSSACVGAFRNRKKRGLPVWFISIREPFVILSKSLMKLASKSVGKKEKTEWTHVKSPFPGGTAQSSSAMEGRLLGFSSGPERGQWWRTWSSWKALAGKYMVNRTVRNSSAFIFHKKKHKKTVQVLYSSNLTGH